VVERYHPPLHINKNNNRRNSYGGAPVSGVQGSWTANMSGRYELKIVVWNKWDKDIVYRFIDVQTTTLYQY